MDNCLYFVDIIPYAYTARLIKVKKISKNLISAILVNDGILNQKKLIPEVKSTKKVFQHFTVTWGYDDYEHEPMKESFITKIKNLFNIPERKYYLLFNSDNLNSPFLKRFDNYADALVFLDKHMQEYPNAVESTMFANNINYKKFRQFIDTYLNEYPERGI